MDFPYISQLCYSRPSIQREPDESIRCYEGNFFQMHRQRYPEILINVALQFVENQHLLVFCYRLQYYITFHYILSYNISISKKSKIAMIEKRICQGDTLMFFLCHSDHGNIAYPICFSSILSFLRLPPDVSSLTRTLSLLTWSAQMPFYFIKYKWQLLISTWAHTWDVYVSATAVVALKDAPNMFIHPIKLNVYIFSSSILSRNKHGALHL